MICPHCGVNTPVSLARCVSCDRALPSDSSAGEMTFLPMSRPPGGAWGSTTDNSADGVTMPVAGLADDASWPADADLTMPAGGDSSQPANGGAGRWRSRQPGAPLVPGEEFGSRYHIIRQLGVGGMGEVYQAWDSELGVSVALKVIRPEIVSDPAAVREMEQRFKRELLLARQVTHKNVLRIHDLGEVDSTKYITMPYVQGADLRVILTETGRLPVAAALRFARQVASGLQAAHEAGVVHRDLKPANIMLEADQAYITDFGIARSGPAPSAQPGGGIVGTLEYMAPEQVRGQEDHRADIYSFGLIVREMLVGRRAPVPDGTSAAERLERVQQAPPPPRAVDPTIPEGLDRVVARCLETDPAARYQTAGELVADLDRLDDAGNRMPEPRLRRVSAPVAAAAVLLLSVMFAAAWWSGRRAAPAVPVTRDPVSVLVADFRNRTNDPVFDGSLEQALTLGVEGSSFITSYPRRDAQALAQQLAPGFRLEESVARLVSVREGIKVVLAGSIEPAGRGYGLTVNALDSTNGRVLTTETASAAGKADVLPAVNAIAARLRRALGDAGADVAAASEDETFTAASLEAAREYSLAQDLAPAGKDEQAIAHYRRAVELDPGFGRAYAGWAASADKLGRREEAAELWKKAMSLMERMTDREKYRTLGGYYLRVARNYDSAIDNFQALVKAFPADGSGHNNLALAYFSTLNFAKALEAGRELLRIYPKKVLYRANYALYAMYAGDFRTAAEEGQRVIEQDKSYFKAYLPLAVAAIDRDDPAGARDAYDRMAMTSPRGASLAAAGLADLAAYEGRYADAIDILTPAIAEDQKTGNQTGLAKKLIALAETQVALGRRRPAGDEAARALKASRSDAVLVPAAAIFVGVGREADARAIAGDLSTNLQAQTRAYAKIVEGLTALRGRRFIEAVEAFRGARDLSDSWLARYYLGVAYVEGGHFAEGLSEFEACEKRRGEASAVFLDDVPTFRYLAPVKYWLARAQEGVGLTEAAARNYQAYLVLRTAAPGDELAADARRRLGAR